jgi:hypothetical protein
LKLFIETPDEDWLLLLFQFAWFLTGAKMNLHDPGRRLYTKHRVMSRGYPISGEVGSAAP